MKMRVRVRVKVKVRVRMMVSTARITSIASAQHSIAQHSVS